MMKNKRSIVVYKDLNDPYWDMLKRGLTETPEERFENFFRERANFRKAMGIESAVERKIVVKKASWM